MARRETMTSESDESMGGDDARERSTCAMMSKLLH